MSFRVIRFWSSASVPPMVVSSGVRSCAMAGRITGRGFGLIHVALWGLLLCEMMFSGSAVQPSGMLGLKTRKLAPSVLSLFNMKLKSQFWSDDVMARVNDDWNLPEHTPYGKQGLSNYTQAGNVAAYLGFSAVDAIHFPIPVNFIFIGFDKEGNHQIELGRDELERWFTNIDHIVEHTRIPQLGESLTPFYRVRADGKQRHTLPLVSSVHYNFSVHAIDLGPGVAKVIEQAITVLARKENITDTKPDTEAVWQVDIESMEHIFDSLVDYLELDKSYNVFVLNPRRDTSRGVYGYRRGLSQAEANFLSKDEKSRAQLRSTRRSEQYNLFEAVDKSIKRPLYSRHPMRQFHWTTAESFDTAQWVDAYKAALASHAQVMKTKQETEISVFQAKQILLGADLGLSAALERHLRPDGGGLKSDCLTDTWVSKKRWAFIDLTAGPFTWGPTVGGEGVRLLSSLPSVERSFENVTWKGDVRSDADLQTEVQTMVQDKFAAFGADYASVIDMLMAELDVYEMFAANHCTGRKIRLALCGDLVDKLAQIREELETFQLDEPSEEEKTKASEVLKRMDGWSMFKDIHVHEEEFAVARDRFLSHLGATLSSSMKHVLTTSTAEGSFHYYEKIYFRIYIITEEKEKGRKSAVDDSAIKGALSSLIMPSQKVEYSTQKLSLADDAALAMAFAVARQAAVVPVLALNGSERPSQRIYLDSLILWHQLQQQITTPEKNFRGRSVLEVPIFWLVQSGEPLLIDKHYVAKALPDMVIVVQSSHTAWESHLQCNNKSILWDLSQPLSAAIAATAEHLAGLLPAHVTYSHAHENAIQDWTWSTGCHPFSSTAEGSHVSVLHNDAIARSYIVTALDESIQTVNEAIARLVKENTYPHTFLTVKDREYTLLQNYNTLVNLWKQIVKVGEELKFDTAMRLLNNLEIYSKGVAAEADGIIAALHPIHCTRQRKLDKSSNTFAGVAIAGVVLILWLFLRPRRRKPKLN